MSAKDYPNPDMVKPHRCAYLIDDILDAMEHWHTDEMKIAYHAFRECQRNPVINADKSQKPRYLTPKENYQDLFDSDKAKQRNEAARVEAKKRKEESKKKKNEEN